MGRSKKVKEAIEFFRKQAFWSLPTSVNFKTLMDYIAELEKRSEIGILFETRKPKKISEEEIKVLNAIETCKFNVLNGFYAVLDIKSYDNFRNSLGIVLNTLEKLQEESKADKAEIRLLKDIIKDCEKDNISKEKIREKKAIVEKKLRKPKARRINKRNGGLINGSGTKRKSSNRSNKRIKQK